MSWERVERKKKNHAKKKGSVGGAKRGESKKTELSLAVQMALEASEIVVPKKTPKQRGVRVSFDLTGGNTPLSVSGGSSSESGSTVVETVLQEWSEDKVTRDLQAIKQERELPEPRLAAFGLLVKNMLAKCKPSILLNFKGPLCYVKAESKEKIMAFLKEIPVDDTDCFIRNLLNDSSGSPAQKLLVQLVSLSWPQQVMGMLHGARSIKTVSYALIALAQAGVDQCWVVEFWVKTHLEALLVDMADGEGRLAALECLLECFAGKQVDDVVLGTAVLKSVLGANAMWRDANEFASGMWKKLSLVFAPTKELFLVAIPYATQAEVVEFLAVCVRKDKGCFQVWEQNLDQYLLSTALLFSYLSQPGVSFAITPEADALLEKVLHMRGDGVQLQNAKKAAASLRDKLKPRAYVVPVMMFAAAAVAAVGMWFTTK